jgi:hypothetical protein
METNKINEHIMMCLDQKEITHYSARIEQSGNTKLGTSQVQFLVKFTSNSRIVHEEMRLYDEIWLLGSLGGSLGLFVGFSLFDSVAVLFDKFVALLSKI